MKGKRTLRILCIFIGAGIATYITPAMACPAGQYMGTDGKCATCNIGYYCPGDDTQHYCGDKDTYYDVTQSPYYADERGLSECKPCPKLNEAGIPTAYIQFYWYYENYSPVHTSIEYCRAVWNWPQTYGTIRADCPYNLTAGYTKSTKCQVSVSASWCNAGYYVDTSRDFIYIDTGSNLGITGGFNTIMTTEFCTPVEKGYYQTGNSILATACPAGTGTHTTGATSAAACIALCGAGATKLHAGNYTFNMWPSGQCSSPAIQIGLSGGTCCVNLESGTGVGLNIQTNGKTYHAVD